MAALPLLPLAIAERSNTAAAGTGPILATYSVPASIDATGGTDVTRALQAFLDRVPHHSEIDFPAGAKYRIEGTLRVVARNDLVIDGHGATFFATQPTASRTRSQWSFGDDSNLEVANMTIRGANKNAGVSDGAYVEALEAQHGINIVGGERINVHNVDITDTYGDFIFIGRSPAPVSGHPRDVHIHDNVLNRNGRMGITVADATGVTIDHNTISNTRRATIDLEPYAASQIVRNISITDNQINAGRLFFVAGHGMGDVSDVFVTRNTLHAHSMGVDMVAPDGRLRHNVEFTGNVSDTANATPRGAVMRFFNYDGVIVRDNVQPTPWNRLQAMVVAVQSCNVVSENNDLGDDVRQLVIDSPRAGCLVQTAANPGAPANFFDGQRLAIDVGNLTTSAVSCTDAAHCDGYLTELGPHAKLVTASVPADGPVLGVADRTMLMGNILFSIPIRNGTYRVTMSFVEPAFRGPGLRRFNVDSEDQRRLLAFDTYERSGGTGLRVHRAFNVTVGDGTLEIRFGGGEVPAIVSYITVVRS